VPGLVGERQLFFCLQVVLQLEKDRLNCRHKEKGGQNALLVSDTVQ
jgi:hypothetical protein